MTISLLWQQTSKKPKHDDVSTAVILEDDDDELNVSIGDNLNSSITEGSVTRALYGDEKGIAYSTSHHLIGLLVTMVTCVGLLTDPDELLSWLQHAMVDYDLKVANFTESWSNGMALAALIHRYHPDLINYYSLRPANAVDNNKLVSGWGW